jgi:hypothetical protein
MIDFSSGWCVASSIAAYLASVLFRSTSQLSSVLAMLPATSSGSGTTSSRSWSASRSTNPSINALRVRKYALVEPSGNPARRSTARWVSPRMPCSATSWIAASVIRSLRTVLLISLQL